MLEMYKVRGYIVQKSHTIAKNVNAILARKNVKTFKRNSGVPHKGHSVSFKSLLYSKAWAGSFALPKIKFG